MWIKRASVCGVVSLISLIAGWSPVLAQVSRMAQGPAASEVPLQVIVVRSAGEAKEVHDRLQKGQGFRELARETSIDPTADGGGYMGILDPVTLRVELREALAGVRPGQITAWFAYPRATRS
jgi:parvulin-like peptidyl-prolyl isomerase